MATIARGTKSSAGGGTAFVASTDALASEINTDFDTVYTLVNGSLDNDNIAASADIALTKLADISGTAAAHDDTTTPGDSSSHTLPTTLSGELQQLRYVAERQALGLAADRVDGSGTGSTFWGDLPARGPNLVKNPSFADGSAGSSTPPDGWTDLGTGTPTFSSVALAAATLTEGKGRELRIQAGSAAVAGVTQTLSGLKASTQYLVVARARSTTSAVHLKTTGADAASSFRNIDDSSTSTSYVTLKGVIKTDSTPTNIVLQLTTNGANGDDVKFAFCGVYECAADHVQICGTPTAEDSAVTSYNVPAASFTAISDISETVVCPGDGFEIHVEATFHFENTSGTSREVGLNVVENGSAVADHYREFTIVNGDFHTETVIYKKISPTPGTAYAYTFTTRASGGSSGDIQSPGSAAVTGAGTKTNRVYVRAVRVSQ
jgi:hypothetical protein